MFEGSSKPARPRAVRTGKCSVATSSLYASSRTQRMKCSIRLKPTWVHRRLTAPSVIRVRTAQPRGRRMDHGSRHTASTSACTERSTGSALRTRSAMKLPLGPWTRQSSFVTLSSAVRPPRTCTPGCEARSSQWGLMELSPGIRHSVARRSNKSSERTSTGGWGLVRSTTTKSPERTSCAGGAAAQFRTWTVGLSAPYRLASGRPGD